MRDIIELRTLGVAWVCKGNIESMEKEKNYFIDVERVKAIMKEKGIDEKAFASLMGFTLPTVKKFLDGADQNNLSWRWLINIRAALKTPINNLLHKEHQI